MRGPWIAALLPVLALGARAADEEYVTAKDRIMCTTQQSLREALRAIDTKDRQLFETIQGCHYSIEGVHAELLIDSVSMVKIRIGPPGNPSNINVWVLPDTIKPVNRR
jgi:hypothetical protein